VPVWMTENYVVALIGVGGTLIGTIIGFGFSELAAWRRERKARSEERADFELFAEIARVNRENKLYLAEIASETHMRAERLVARGMLTRHKDFQGPVYSIPATATTIEERQRIARLISKGGKLTTSQAEG
jgi:hypothetical protein